MSELRSAIDQLTAVDPSTLTLEELAGEVEETQYGLQALWVRLAGLTGEMDSRAGNHYFGYPSMTAYLADRGRMSYGHARRIIVTANAAHHAPETYRAWTTQQISTDQAEKLFALAEAVPDVYPEAETALVEIITDLSVRDTVRALEYWRQSVDGPGEADPESQMLRRRVSVSAVMEGIRRLDGDLTTTCRETLNTALNTIIGIPPEDDTRTPRQRRHDALEDLARHYLDHADTPVVGGEKPHLLVLTDLPALQGIAGGTHETLNSGDILDIETIRILACDSSISRILIGPDSEILDVGHKTRVWSPAQQRAITARDRHCVHPGCYRTPDWCDIHHIHHWVDHGQTSVENGELLSRYHHTQRHLQDTQQPPPKRQT